jgi:hypothetical protein
VQTLQNGIPVPTPSDTYNPTEQLADAFGAADVVIRVPSQAARDGLTKRDGMAVSRMDLGGLIEVWDADINEWSIGIQHTEFTGDTGLEPAKPWGPGPLTRDTTQTRYGTDVTSPDRDLIFMPGKRMYAIHIRLKLGAGAVGQTYLSLRWNDTGQELDSDDILPGASAARISIPNLYVPADRILKVYFYSASTPLGTNITTRIRVTRNG